MQKSLTRIPPITIGVKEYEDLKLLTKRDNLTISGAIRNMITIYLDKKTLPVKGKNGTKTSIKDLPFSEFMFHSGSNRVDSTNYKEYLYGKHSKYAHN